MNKIIKQITFQKKLVNINNDVINDVIPNDRVIVSFVAGENEDIINNDAIIDNINNDIISISINKTDMSSGNPNNYDLSTVGSKELLDALLIKLNAKINE